jgi:hypothetical protein
MQDSENGSQKHMTVSEGKMDVFVALMVEILSPLWNGAAATGCQLQSV